MGDRLNLALDVGYLVVRGRKEVGLERIPNLFHGLKIENDVYLFIRKKNTKPIDDNGV